MTDNIAAVPTLVVRVDHNLTAADMADAILSEFFHPEETGADHSPRVARAWVEKLTRRHITQFSRHFMRDRSGHHWRTLVTGHWTEDEIADAHTDAMTHVERCYPELIQWATRSSVPASGLQLDVYPVHDTRWARVSRERDGWAEVITTTTSVDSAYRLFDKLHESFIEEETRDLD